MNHVLFGEFVRLVRDDALDITMDDVTLCGQVMLDPLGEANGAQNGIGSFFPALAKRGWVVKTGEVRASRSPRRRGGMIRVWRITDRAREELA